EGGWRGEGCGRCSRIDGPALLSQDAGGLSRIIANGQSIADEERTASRHALQNTRSVRRRNHHADTVGGCCRNRHSSLHRVHGDRDRRRQKQSQIGSDAYQVASRVSSVLRRRLRTGHVPVVLDTTAGNTVGAVSPRNAGGTERRYHLFNCVRHYYANGGGPCYIVSVGSYSDAPALGTVTTGLLGGLTSVAPVDDPTLLVFPDSVSLSVTEMGSLQVAALAQCELLQDRFVIMDLCQGDQPASPTLDPIANFRQNVGTNSLRYGAAYYPWVRTIYAPDVHFRQLTLVTPALGAITNATIDGLTGDAVLDALVPAVRTADSTVGAVVSAVNVGGMTNPGALTLTRANFPQLTNQFATLLDR